MDVVFDNIYSLFAFSVVFLLIYTILLIAYFIHKNGFQVKVNCWFCNKDSKVLYIKRNNFECPFCSQYNGFDKDGDYNKIIEAQRNESLNTSSNGIYQQILSPNLFSNGLCENCNKNIQLKTSQLAKYEPLNENNYDAEIEHFEKQLDKTYNLCKTCVRTVKNTIRKQNAWIFGNRLKKNGLSYVKLNNHSQGETEVRHFFSNFSVISYTLIVISVLNLCSLYELEIVVFKDILPKSVLPSHVIFSDIYSNLYNVTQQLFGKSAYFTYLPKMIKTKESSILIISLLGLGFETIFTFIEKNWTFFGKCNKLLSWLILGLISSINFGSSAKDYINTLQIFCSVFLLYSYIYRSLNFEKKQEYKFKHYKIQTELDNLDDESDTEFLNNTDFSHRTSINKRSPFTAKIHKENSALNKSYVSTKPPKTHSFNNTTFMSLHNGGNTELNETFHNMNLGVFDPPRPMSCQSFQSNNVNPFSNGSRPQSPSSTNFIAPGNMNKSFSQSFTQQSPNPLFKLQNTTSNSGNSLSFSKSPSAFAKTNWNDSGYSKNVLFTAYKPNSDINFQMGHGAFIPSDTSSVHPDMAVNQSSPSYFRNNDLNCSQSTLKTSYNDSFRPLSPIDTSSRTNRTFLSPSKLSYIKTINSEARDNESVNLSLHSQNISNSNVWPRLNGFNSHYNQSIVVNSLTKVCPTNGLNGTFVIPDKNISRSSSSSSGFVSNGGLMKAQASSLPNSRDHSPDRNSILSEPAFHFRLD